MRLKIIYIISDINKSLAFEWIAAHLDKEKFELSFILLLQQPAVLETFLKSENIPCQTFYYTGKKDYPRLFLKVYQHLKKVRPDVVHCHMLHGSLLGLTAARLAGIKKRIYTRHHSDFHQRYFPKGIKWDKWCNRMATAIVAPSGAVKEVLLEFEKVEESKINVIQHGFDLNYFNNVPDELVAHLKEKYKTEGYQPVVGVISRFTQLKGIQYIIPAFQRLLHTYPNALLMLFNAIGDYGNTIKQQLQSLPERNYRIVAFENDISAVYRLFDVFIQVSTDRTIEAFGQTYVEALASKVPSVFTLSGIAPDFIKDRENALVVPFKNSEAIYNAMFEICRNSELREHLKSNGWKSVQKQFSLAVMIQKLEELYVSE